MKKFSQLIWNLYKESEKGKELIALFQNAQSSDFTSEEMLTLAKFCNSRLFNKESEEDDQWYVTYHNDVMDYIRDSVDAEKQAEITTNKEERRKFFERFLADRNPDSKGVEFADIPQGFFKYVLSYSICETWAMYRLMPKAFIPNFFAFQFNYLSRFAHEYEIDLPAIPNRSSYKDRCTYYIELNEILWDYAKLSGIKEPAEVCAFWFGLALRLAQEEIEEERTDLPDIPEQVWLLVGNYSKEERHMMAGVWQANPMTVRGDVLMFYEKSPVKKMNSFWIAKEEGVADPFFHFYGYTYIGNKVEIPEEQALTYDDFKASEYFKVENRGKKGNYVSKNFQDCSGWPIPYDDYAEIKRMLEAKGFDTSVMPSLYEPKEFSTESIGDEKGVYEKLVTPLLEQMGWKEGVDFSGQVGFAAGRGTTGHAINKFPDYCLHMTRHGKKIYAKVVIEAKYFIKNNRELENAFDQCLNYASWGKAKVLVLCDKNTIYVYEQDRNGQFDLHHHRTRYRWAQLNNPEIFKDLKRKLDIK